MNKFFLTLLTAFVLISCKEQKASDDQEMPAVNDEQVEDMAYLNYGSSVSLEDAIVAEQLHEKFITLKDQDTLNITVKGTIKDVCTNKGCWIKIPVGSETAFVKFKDYGFFLPRNSQGKEVVLSGKAYKSITPVSELRHYAEDEGKSAEEVAAITEDKVTYSFMADGALVEEYDNPDVFTPQGD